MNKLDEIIRTQNRDSCNEFARNVALEFAKHILEEAAENAEITERRVSYKCSSGVEFGYVNKVNKNSITDTLNKYL